MKDLFTLDIKNYLPQWNKEKRDSSRGIIMTKEKKFYPFLLMIRFHLFLPKIKDITNFQAEILILIKHIFMVCLIPMNQCKKQPFYSLNIMNHQL